MKKSLLHTGPLFAGALDAGLLLLRLGTGGLLAPHGYDKLLTLLAGQSADFPDPLGVGPLASHVLAVGGELVCSLLVLLGLFTRPALIGLLLTTATIVLGVHAQDSFADREHALLFLIPAGVLFLTGPGRYALDARWASRRRY
jgi:putative oxidoreductase